jgi:hypothetical protein|tara:strand:- start:519 stop:1046 length:528 start_codon:yes stop_codon:yes gene_type:complete
MSVDSKLDGVTRARSAFVLARTTLEQQLREQLKRELSNLQTQVDIAVRYAYDEGASKASILRAMGTKYYGTLQDSLARTEGVAEAVGVDPLDSVYSFDAVSQLLTVDYAGHGPNGITGGAVFKHKKMEDGTHWLFSETPLYTEDYSVRNKVVGVLDQKQDGYYYEEAMRWINENS